MSEQQDPELDALVDALRGDVPSERDRDRVRRKLVAAGVAVSAGSALSGAAVAKASAASASAASTGAAGAGVVGASVGAKLAGLSLAAKISTGVVVLASASALSVYDAGERSSRSSTRKPVTASVVAAAPVRASAAPAAEEPALVEPSVIAAPAAPVAVAAPARLRSPSPRARAATLQSTPPEAPTPEVAASAPPPSAPLPSALRAEAELLERALSALHAGELESARRALSAHAERFPQGALRRERERAEEQLTLLAAARTDR